jgi:hypothetical protein
MDEAVAQLLAIGFRHRIVEPNLEAGYEQFRALGGACLDHDQFRAAIDACLRGGLIREPVRLPQGALQCHWRLELTPAGVALARGLDPNAEGEG